MESRHLFKRRAYLGVGNEPFLNYLYRISGFLIAVVLFLGGLVTLTIAPILPMPFVPSLVGAAFGMAIFWVGLIASEVWAYANSRKKYSPASSPYSRKHLALATAGFSISAAAMILLILLL